MDQTYHSTNYGGDAAGNYQKFFVPSIGAPIAKDLLAIADLKPGERVVDVACGTGAVTRMAAEAVGPTGTATGLDLNPGMLAVARTCTDGDLPIEWIEADAEAMPLDDGAYDVALCQMGLQFVSGKLAALREMRRVLAAGGRIHVNLPGPKPALFQAMGEGIARHIGSEPAMFMDLVFSMSDQDELRDLFQRSGFRDVSFDVSVKHLTVPPPGEFLWQYIHSTPLAEAAMQLHERIREDLENEVVSQWQTFVVDDHMEFDVGMTTVSAAA